jgi:excinuclease UvrABC nuclease subunit
MDEPDSMLAARLDLPESSTDAELNELTLAVPARWAVILLADQQNRPVQLLYAKDARACVRRRLQSPEQSAAGKRVNYREIVRQIRWQRVDSGLEADLIYLQAARHWFPKTYQGMVGFRPAWFIHVDPEAEFPRYVKTIDLYPKPGVFFGPVADKHAAGSLIELVEDLFDLCRYFNILVQSPHGKACPYKEMGKCPAPCDGSISMDQYRWLIRHSVATLTDPKEAVRQETRRMKQAAGDLRFELAARIKAYVEQLERLSKGSYRHLRPLSDLVLVSLQRGPDAGTAKVFLIRPSGVEQVVSLISRPLHTGELLRAILESADGQASPSSGTDTQAAEQLGVLSQHLFSGKNSPGAFISLIDLTEQNLAKGLQRLEKQPETSSPEQDVVRELTAIE